MKKINLKYSDLIDLDFCPLCSSASHNELGSLNNDYITRHYALKYPHNIKLLECNTCGLIYKSSILKKHIDELIYSQYSSSNKNRWGSVSSSSVFNKSIRKKKYNKVIEIGPGEAPLVNCFEESKKYFLVSDKLQSKHLEEDNNVYQFYIDDDEIDNQLPDDFDLLVMFDVIEHVSSPANAFKNIAKILRKKGTVIIQSGLVDSAICKKRGVNWGYFHIPEHRVFFSEKSIKYLCSEFNFNLVSFQNVFHKSISSPTLLTKTIIIYLLYKFAPKIYKKYIGRGVETNVRPELPSRDHFLILMENFSK